MANSIIRVAYAVLKKNGIDTTGMRPSEAIEMFNKLNSGEKSFERKQTEQKLLEKGYTKEQIDEMSDADVNDKIDKFEPRRYNSIRHRVIR